VRFQTSEAIAGGEPEFAVLMTRTAQILGMVNTMYVNASGLPVDAQITTAREQALLGRAIQERFPEYSRYFAIPSFHYRGTEISNHNALLREMPGIDGIKTGYTEASGYNLVASMRRDGRHLIGVVLGEKSNGARNARMRQLIEGHLSQASPEEWSRPQPGAPAPTRKQTCATSLWAGILLLTGSARRRKAANVGLSLERLSHDHHSAKESCSTMEEPIRPRPRHRLLGRSPLLPCSGMVHWRVPCSGMMDWRHWLRSAVF
jgi:hypothetical protein